VDILPSIAHLLGLTPAADWQGASVFAPDHPGRAYVLDDLSGLQLAVIDARYKYIARVTDRVERLYDLHADPLELHDVVAAHPSLVAERRGRIAAFIRAEEQYMASRPKAPSQPQPGPAGVPPLAAPAPAAAQAAPAPAPAPR
jgi:arylsulfatase A-like enzyme